MHPEICREVNRCRLCGSLELSGVADLGSQYIASIFSRDGVPDHLAQPFPLEVVRCSSPDGCGLVQLRHSIDPQVLYDHYGYRSGTNELMRQNLSDMVVNIEEIVDLSAGDLVLDIGCNDGTLLKSYSTVDLKKVGVDPSDAVVAIEDERIEVLNDFFSADLVDRLIGDQKAKAITSIAMFYDLEDPIGFARDVASLLSEDGVWVLELSYLPSMLEANSFDTVCHEHLEYYGLRQLRWVAEATGLQIAKVELNDVNGGSVRCFFRPSGVEVAGDQAAAVAELLTREDELGLATDVPYKEFEKRCQAIRDELVGLIDRIIADSGVVYAYGASTKGNTLLQYCGLDSSKITKAADRNPDKWGTRTLGTDIPIISEEEARSDGPDYFLVLPWHFIESFVKRESEFLENGGRFLLPLPEVRILGRADVSPS